MTVSIPENALLLCSVGRHVVRKGFAWFADEVMPRLPKDVVWLLAGEGPETRVVRDAVRRRGGLDARVMHRFRPGGNPRRGA